MEFKSQICTTKEQSERLLALGLKKETADMSWFRRSKNADFEYCTASYTEWVEEIMPIITDYTLQDIIPAWSLHRLIEIAEVSARISGVFGYGENNNIYDELIDTMQDFINNDVFNKDYLIKE